jgi:phenylpropionate dioxygenase-like ring-hydroxylating dioxygenase large terminal subunit
MFINFWYPLAESAKLTDTPLLAKMLGQDFVLFRDSAGAAHCLSNICVHRGGSLAHGRIKGDCIQCSYHGWKFDGEGKCTRIPMMAPDAKLPPRAKVDSYPVQEKYGLVFAFLGDLLEEERIPVLPIPEYGQPGWAATIQHWVFDFNYHRGMENGVDPSHNEFVHPTHGYSGERDDYHLKERKALDHEWGSWMKLGGIAPALPDPKMREASGRSESGFVESETGHHGVASIWTYIHPSKTMFIHQYLFESPIDEFHTDVYIVNLRNFLIEGKDDNRMMERNQYVGFQDRDVLLQVRPRFSPKTNIKETFVKGDECVARYREWVKKWQAKGWRIDVAKVNATKDEVAYAIPSPARRNSKNWVIDAVPLLPAAEEQVSAAPTVAALVAGPWNKH